MTVYFAHVGEENSSRDFPRTIGIGNSALSMSKEDFGNFGALVPSDLSAFQTWGIPERADPIHRNLKVGDWFLLVGTIGGGGGVDYIGKVVHVLPTRQPELSSHLWTESRFPWIFLMKGEMHFVPWPTFLHKIGYAPNFDPRGRVFGVSKQKMQMKGYHSDFEIIQALKGSDS